MRRVPLVLGVAFLAMLLPMVLVAALLSSYTDQASPSERALREIPPDLLGVYRAATETCPGLAWTVLAAIHKVETNYGTGPRTSNKGAQGPMQFMPATFAVYGVDGDGDGSIDIGDVDDAIFSATHLLCANGAGDPAHLATAVWDYNHSQAYVNQVLTLAAALGVVEVPDGVAYAGPGALLDDTQLVVTPQARADLEAGAVDRRIVGLLAWITERHTIGISVFVTGHSPYTRSGTVSNHFYGRAVDILFVDGRPVSVYNATAERLVRELASMSGALRPDELGHPFGAIGFPGGFTDADHADHIHIGFDA